MTAPLLEVVDLDVRYGPSQALFGVTVAVAPGSVLAVLGVNGAGKSTFARTVSGLVAPSAGRVTFDGHDITGLPAHRIRRLGLTYIPEGRGIFPGLSVTDNLRMAVAQEPRNARATAIERAIERFPVLGKRPSQRAGSLSGGEQQMLTMAPVMVKPPALLIADEPTLGLAPLIVEQIMGVFAELRDQGVTLLVVEERAKAVLDIADDVALLELGRLVWVGPREDLDPAHLTAIYLGQSTVEEAPTPA